MTGPPQEGSKIAIMTDTSIFTLRPVRLTDQIVERLREHIVVSRLRPGDPLPGEIELSRRFGVGRPTVREAMKALAGMGLIQVSNGRSPVVAALSGESVGQILAHGLAVQQISQRETLEFRRFVEENSVRLAATHRSPDELAELDEEVRGMHATLGDADPFAEHDVAFHRILARASGNVLVGLVIDGIAEAALASSRRGLSGVRTPGQWKVVLFHHEQIFAAVAAGNAEAAGQAMRLHFDVAHGWLRPSAEQPEIVEGR
jgi:GntR family transcriptional repressor for pyruvate dehydrogenase complex